jgi:hypothetical protein
MKPLFNQEEFNNAKSRDKLLCECYICQQPFFKIKYDIQKSLKTNKEHKTKYCSIECQKTSLTVNCSNCNVTFKKTPFEIKKTKNHFCSQSCAATYNNNHKTKGNRRSKLEKYIEEQLTIIYPNLEIHFNQKSVIGSELDIYIPSLRLAFELNGIFHYEPIYGRNKLNQIQSNDTNKFKKCLEHEISLCIIDTSSQKYFKEQTSTKFLKIITDIINPYLSNS